MSMNYPLGDMLARIRNGQSANKNEIPCPASRLLANVLDVFEREGYIRGYRRVKNARGLDELIIEPKYDQGRGAISEMDLLSKPGRRVYSRAADLPRFYNGLGILVVSTPRGVMSDREARDQNVGGEVLCQVF